MAVGEIITAARYNLMQAKVKAVLGNGSGLYGYGQTTESSAVQVVTNIVRASHMQKLKSDLNKCVVHQTNVATTVPDIAVEADITDPAYAQYEAESDSVYANHLQFDLNQMTAPESKVTSRRTQAWGGGGDPQVIRHEFTVKFDDADHARHFFNSGGEIRFRGTLTGGVGAKYTEWLAMFTTMGIVKIDYNTTTADSGTAFNIGFDDLTTAYQTIWTKAGSGAYSENLITYKAKANGKTLTILAEFYDGEALAGVTPGTAGVDERVNGTLTSIIEQQRATGSFVEVATPVYKNTIELG